MSARRFAYRSLQALALAVAGGGMPLLAADAPATAAATQPASRPALEPTEFMWDWVNAQVVGGQLMLVPVKTEALYTGQIATMANVAGTASVQVNTRSEKAFVYRVLTEGKVTHAQSALLKDTESGLYDAVRDTETGAADVVVYAEKFAAAAGTATAPAPRVALTVYKREVSTPKGKPDPVVLKLEAASFGDLCAKHPDEVTKYIEPIFRALDLGGIFFVEPEDARHVFAANARPDPVIVAKVQAILPRLDDDSSEVRKAAAAELAALGDAAVAPVKALDLSKQPRQTRSMLQTFLESAGTGAEDPRLSNPDFLLLCVALDDKQIPALAKARLEKLQGKPVDVDIAAPAEERRNVVRKMLYAGWAAQPPQK